MLGLDAAILRPPFFGDVHPAHRLQSRSDRQVHQLRHALNLVQHAVNSKSNDRVLALRFDVNVGSTRVVRMLQQKIDGVDDVRIARLDLRA